MYSNDKKKIIIIGAGISGLTAAIYALDNGYDVEIYEKHYIAGGQCTGWNRDNIYIDGCAHWIVGTSKKSQFNKIWRHIGAFNEDSKIYETEYFTKFDINGEIITFYSDLKKLENELLRVAPEDKKMIKKFIKAVKVYQLVKIPLKKPSDMMNLFELIEYGFPLLRLVPYLLKYKHVSNKYFASKCKSIYLKEIFTRIMEKEYNIHSLMYIMQNLSQNDAGMVEGGSKKMVQNILNTYIKKGGKIFLNKEVDHIIVDNNVAKGIVLKDGSNIYSDYVVASGDVYHTLHKLLDNKYEDKYYLKRFNNIKDYPLQQCLQVSLKVNKNMDDYPKMMNIKIKDLKIGDYVVDYINIRNHSFDKTLYKEDVAITLLVHVDDSVYTYFSSLDKKEYENEKNRIGNILKNEVKQYYHIDDKDISLIDVTTPLTYERYTNAYRGSYMSFITTEKSKGLMNKGLIKGLKNFALAGQWIMPPGGLPIAAFSGKYSIIRICKMDKKKFINVDNS